MVQLIQNIFNIFFISLLNNFLKKNYLSTLFIHNTTNLLQKVYFLFLFNVKTKKFLFDDLFFSKFFYVNWLLNVFADSYYKNYLTVNFNKNFFSLFNFIYKKSLKNLFISNRKLIYFNKILTTKLVFHVKGIVILIELI